ncbi:hypothetical protein ANOM_002795 [Aspergillus nomiae NRRL 13137]|uniref:Uncharacterized protein n=1 Tax=Aspergillus nomiae NRRL (strain ATCC 15546 / NRRL 13137 / CBS 260.88 / M93) TaxID=1509407 RepID=A0A0L1JAI8_ASPN3|nr:uncharacterized protein ANOM_002795 [Aspergillus nomiae NRRL 13137]KNG88769.1 hypothetical protein ANOM_002795 [Aspergillus nomiae NRRL 13137]
MAQHTADKREDMETGVKKQSSHDHDAEHAHKEHGSGRGMLARSATRIHTKKSLLGRGFVARTFNQGQGPRSEQDSEPNPERASHRKNKSKSGGSPPIKPSQIMDEHPGPNPAELGDPEGVYPSTKVEPAPNPRTRDDNDRKRLQAQVRSARSGSWVTKSSRQIREELSSFEAAMRHWAENYSVGEIRALDSLPIEEKDAILERLSGYCAQVDWTTLIEKASTMADNIPALLMQALLAKDIFGTIFANPFFAFGESKEPSTAHASQTLSFLYASMLDVNKEEAHIWRSQTLRLLATPPPNSVHNAPLRAKVEAITSELAVDFLAGPVQLLFRHRNDSWAIQRNQELYQLYQTAGDLAISLWTQRSFMRCYCMDELPIFRAEHPVMSAHALHRPRGDDTRLDGKNALIIVHPAIVAFGNEYAEHYDLCKVWAKGIILVDEHA